MLTNCPSCGSEIEVSYFIKTKNQIACITFNIKCHECGGIVPMMITPHKTVVAKKESKEIKSNPDYIG